jgi:small acid-soluble spore protein H (minor)
MNSQRAKEIVSSPDMVNVTYGNTPVYMEMVNDSDQTCTIHYLNQPNEKMNVPLSSLVER